MQLRLVVNPRASGVTRQGLTEVRRALASGHDVEVVATRCRDDATALARDAVADGVDAVAVLGGDGTLNEALAPLVGTDVALLPLPGGGTNVFCRSLGLSDDPAVAARRMGDALGAGCRRRIGVGTVSVDGGPQRPFVIHTGLGWDAALVERVEAHAALKPRLGHLVFVAAGLSTFLGGYDRHAPHLRVTLADGTVIDDGYFALVLNSDPYTYVGHRPFVVDPSNDPADTGLDVVVLQTLAVPRFLAVMAEALRGGGLRERPWLHVRRDVAALTVERTSAAALQVDGDHIGAFDTARFSHRRDALWISDPRAPLGPRPDGW